MTHIDEHILEFHVLGVAETAGRKMEIEAHLAECTGCRVLAENIRKFYQDASKELASGTEVVHKSAGSLVRRKSQNSLIYEPIVGPVINMPPLKMQRFRRKRCSG